MGIRLDRERVVDYVVERGLYGFYITATEFHRGLPHRSWQGRDPATGDLFRNEAAAELHAMSLAYRTASGTGTEAIVQDRAMTCLVLNRHGKRIIRYRPHNVAGALRVTAKAFNRI